MTFITVMVCVTVVILYGMYTCHKEYLKKLEIEKEISLNSQKDC